MEFFLNNKVQKKSRVLSDICLPSSLCTHLHDSVCKKQKYLSSSFTKSRRNSIVSARSQQVFSIHSLFCSTEKRENLWTISQGCWTWCAEQKVNSLSKHMLYFSEPTFSKSICASPTWAAAALLCREGIWARRGQRQSADKALRVRSTTKGQGRGRWRTCFTEVSLSNINPLR